MDDETSQVMTQSNQQSNSIEDRQLEFYKLALKCKQFLKDHNIETFTDTTIGHMAIFIQEERDLLLIRADLLGKDAPQDEPDIKGPATPENIAIQATIIGGNKANAAWKRHIHSKLGAHDG